MNEEREIIYVIGHTDLDGIGAIALIVSTLPEDSIRILLQDPSKEFPYIKAHKVFIADVAVTAQTFGSLKNLEAQEIIWIDHHKPGVNISNTPANLKLILDPNSPSASLMVQKYFNLNDPISVKISEIATRADTWRLDTETQDWMDAVAGVLFFKENPETIVSALKNLDITKVEGILKKYKAEKETAKQELLKNTVVRELHGHTISVSLAPDILTGSESADIVLKNTQSEIQIILKPEGWMSFRRRKDSQVNLITLAKIFNGGGHEYASGAELGMAVSAENFKTVAEAIFEKISSVL